MGLDSLLGSALPILASFPSRLSLSGGKNGHQLILLEKEYLIPNISSRSPWTSMELVVSSEAIAVAAEVDSALWPAQPRTQY